jgi:tagaturonate reductase
VDRIVTGTPQNHPLLAEDPLLIAAEPFAFWGIEAKSERVCLFEHPAITLTPDVRPYALRKVRILNGAHTSLVCKAVPKGFTTVREAVEDPEIGDWLRGLLFEEIVPTMEGRVEDAEKFAGQVLERFANPFLEHKLSDIALYHETKIKVRLVPTFEEYQAKFGKLPARLSEILSHGVTSA